MLIALLALGASQPWSPGVLSDYVRARAGRARGRGTHWCGEGTLQRSSGQRIAYIDCLESAWRTAPTDDGPASRFGVERLLVYRAASGNGSVLELTAGRGGRRRTAPSLEYSHTVGVALAGSGVPEAMALRADGSVVARARTLHASVRRRLFSRVYSLQLQVDGAKPKGATGALSGVASAVGVGGGGVPGTVEEYELHTPRCPGLPAEMRYRRTGPCPSWCNGGVCTTDLWLRQQRRPFFERLRARYRGDMRDAAAGKGAPSAET